MEAAENNLPTKTTCPGCAARDRKIAELEARLAKLETLARGGKRQAAPFSKGPPKPDPKPPGRKAGDDYGTHHRRAIPPHIDQTHEAPLPSACPACGGVIDPIGVAQQYQTEIPRVVIHRQFNVHLGQCACCKKRVRGRHPLQTSDALGAAANQVGPDAQALAVLLNKDAGLSHGKVQTFFKSAFELTIGRSTSCRVMLRAAERCREVHQVIVRRVRSSPTLVPDETGWRVGGLLAWLHVAVGVDATAYLIDRHRGYEASAKLIGEDYAGTMTHDGWKPYDRFAKAKHQTCIGHLLRRCHELIAGGSGGAVLFPRQIKAVLKEGLAIRDRRDAGTQLDAAHSTLSAAAAADEAFRLRGHMDDLLCRRRGNADNWRLSDHLWRNRNHLFTFLTEPGIDATNYKAEQAIRPAVVNRKVFGGNRTEAGAEAQSILMSVLVTAKQTGVAALNFLARTFRSIPTARPELLPETG